MATLRALGRRRAARRGRRAPRRAASAVSPRSSSSLRRAPPQREVSGERPPLRRVADPAAQRQRPLEHDVRVVLPGVADAAEHLQAVLGVVHRGVDRHRDGDGRGQVALAGAAGSSRARAASHATARACSTPHQHVGAHVLDRPGRRRSACRTARASWRRPRPCRGPSRRARWPRRRRSRPPASRYLLEGEAGQRPGGGYGDAARARPGRPPGGVEPGGRPVTSTSAASTANQVSPAPSRSTSASAAADHLGRRAGDDHAVGRRRRHQAGVRGATAPQ